MNFVTFDIETYSPSDSEKIDVNEFRASVIGCYISWIDEYIAFLEEDVRDFISVLKKADLVVGYNHIWFDLPVLQKYADIDLLQLPSYDIMLQIEKKIGFKLKLDDVCKANLGEQKTDSYEQYKNYYKDKNWLPLIDYCMHDVRLTNEIFNLILSEGKLKYKDLLDTREIFLDKPMPGQRVVEGDEPEGIF